MYEELIKSLREDHGKQYFARDMEAADAIEELNAIREEQKAQIILMAAEIEEQLPRWISVEERLPEDMHNVLVTDGKSVGMGWIDDYMWKDTGVVERDWIAPNTSVREDKITHWMPLPEPPKEE